MPGYLLNSETILMCPHGGSVTWAAATFTEYRVGNSPPMLKGDVFTVNGCTFRMGHMINPCMTVEWITGSTWLVVKGRPALTHTSVSQCVSMNGMRLGPAMIASCQRNVMEPNMLTLIPY